MCATMIAQPMMPPCVTPASPQEGTATILVAENDAACLRLTTAVLNQAGYRVLAAADGAQALSVLDRVTPDLILLDRDLPTLHGLQACRRIKADARFTDIPVVLLTTTSDASECADGFAAGAVDYVRKPVMRVELLARIRTHLELARSRRALCRRVAQLNDCVEEQQGRLAQVRDGQESLLTDVAEFPDLQLGVRFQPAEEAGGDFYEIRRLADDVFGFLVADVSGHDLSSAYITGALKALTATFTSECLSVVETMVMLNTGLFKFLDETQYVTASYAKLDRSSMVVDLICAGHPAPLYLSRDGEPEYIELIGDPLGIGEDATFEARRLSMQSGDRLLLFTDGLIECLPDDQGRQGNRLWGMDRLARSVGGKRSVSIAETVQSTVGELCRAHPGRLDDDILLIGVEF